MLEKDRAGGLRRLGWEAFGVFLVKVCLVILAGMFVFDTTHRLLVTPEVMEDHLMR